jgi:hypothetical protein
LADQLAVSPPMTRDTQVNQSLTPSAPGMAVVIDHSRALTAAPVIVFERGGRQKRSSGSVNISSVFDAEDHDFPLEFVDSTLLLVEQLPARSRTGKGHVNDLEQSNFMPSNVGLELGVVKT